MPSRLQRQVVAVAVATTIGFAMAAGPAPHVPSLPDCAGTTLIATSPLYDTGRPGSPTPVEAVDHLAGAGGLGVLATLDGLSVEVHEDQPGPTPPSAAPDAPAPTRTVVVAREGQRPVAVAWTMRHPAGGWQVDTATACTADPVPASVTDVAPEAGR